MPTRRQALKSLLAAGAGTLLTGFYTWRIEPHWLEFTAPALPISGLPSALEGRTLAQLSDLHVGPEVDNAYIVHSFQRLQEHAPDFIVITGDWISYRGQQQLEQLRHVLEHLPHGRLGTLGILGNHDYGRSWSMTDVAKQVDQVASEAGVTMLRNRVVTLAGLQFIAPAAKIKDRQDGKTKDERNNECPQQHGARRRHCGHEDGQQADYCDYPAQAKHDLWYQDTSLGRAENHKEMLAFRAPVWFSAKRGSYSTHAFPALTRLAT